MKIMAWQCTLLFILHFIGSASCRFCNSMTEHHLYRTNPKMASHIETLRNSMRRNNHTPFCFSWNYDNVIGQYVHQQWKTYLRGEPLILQFMCMSASSFGNYLGFYLYNLGCAMHSGTHFVVVHKEFDHKNYLFTHNMSPQLTSADYQRNPIPQHLFFQLLPSIFVHNTPSSYDMSRHIARRDCTCKSFCWEHAESFRNVFKYQWIGKLLCNVVSKYVRITRALEKGTRLASYDSIMLNRTIVSALYLNPLGGLNRYAAQHKSRNPDEMRSGRSESSSMILPLVPNVLIQYRCGDNLNLGKGYGLMPFSTYNRTFILQHFPDEASISTIFIITEGISRSQSLTPCPQCCSVILKALQAHLSAQFPQALVVLKRGGDMFLDYARIAYSSLVFCGASTFCFWPAMANTNGTVVLPVTPLLGGANNISTVPYIGKNMVWIERNLSAAYRGSIQELLHTLEAI